MITITTTPKQAISQERIEQFNHIVTEGQAAKKERRKNNSRNEMYGMDLDKLIKMAENN